MGTILLPTFPESDTMNRKPMVNFPIGLSGLPSALSPAVGDGGQITPSRGPQRTTFSRRLEPTAREPRLDVRSSTPRLKRDFLSTLSHDLLSAIGNVIGYTELLEKKLQDAPPETRHLLKRVMANTEYLFAVVSGTLAATWSPGRQAKAEELDMVTLLSASIARNEAAAAHRGVTLSITPDSSGKLMAVRNPVERILDNLVTNAVKYTPAGRRVWLQAVPDGDGIQLSVKDEGAGLPGGPVHAPLSTLTRRVLTEASLPGSHGLGLKIVKRLSRQLGGTSGVDSIPGQGARFWIRLPHRLVDTHTSDPTPQGALQGA